MDTHDEQRGQLATNTTRDRVVEVLRAHRQVTRGQAPGAVVANPCLCGWGEWGHDHLYHVAQMLDEEGLLADDEARTEHLRIEAAACALLDELDGVTESPWDDPGAVSAINELSAAVNRQSVGEEG